jgi:hypothetical protein
MQGLWGGAVVTKFGFRRIFMLTLKASPSQAMGRKRLCLLLYGGYKLIAAAIYGLDDLLPPSTIPDDLA